METTHSKMSRGAAISAVTSLPQEISSDPHSMRDTLEKCGVALLGLIHDSFVLKMRGGTDEAGDRWAPLSPTTIERRVKKRGGTPPKSLRRYRDALRAKPPLTTAQRRLRSIISDAPTVYDKYGRDAEILHDTGALLESLTPNSGSQYQVLEVGDNTLTVGTTREGAAKHHEGIPSKLPQRRLWPETSRWPQSWWDTILEGVQEGLIDKIRELVGGVK